MFDTGEQLEVIASGGACPSCSAAWEDVVDASPVADGDSTEGGLAMQHNPACRLLGMIERHVREIPAVVFAEGGEWS